MRNKLEAAQVALRGVRLPALAWILLIAAALWATYGTGYLGFDGFYALVWGDQLAHLNMPDYFAPSAPTPHPLLNLVAAPLSLLGTDAPAAFQSLVLLSLAALTYAAYCLGRNLFSWPVGLAFALILVTRPILVGEMLYASVDIPFLALVVGAAALEVARPRRGAAVLVVLGLAGLLRPEAWALAAVYAMYAARGRSAGEAAKLFGLAASAPALWLAGDLIVTGDPLHSLHGTRDLAAQLLRKRTAGAAVAAAPAYTRRILGEPVLWAGAGGCVLALVVMPRRAVLPLAALAAGLATFIGFGAAGLPVLTRYLLMPGAMVALFCAVLLLGWLQLAAGHPLRRIWALGAATIAALIVLSVPAQRHALDSTLAWIGAGREHQRDLRQLVAGPLVSSSYAHCSPVHVSTRRLVPGLAYFLHREPRSIVPADSGSPRDGLMVGPVLPTLVRTVIARSAPSPRSWRPAAAIAPRFRPLTSTHSWNLYESCGNPARRSLLAMRR